ncbi:MAG: SWIM zinc finger family protein, partial [Planctomycetota bacterium]
FPCKHVLALMWMHAEDPSSFGECELPQWVLDWLGRRRTSTGKNASPTLNEKSVPKGSKSMLAAELSDKSKPIDPKSEARKKAAAEKRNKATRESIAGSLYELQQWLEDQLRGGLAAFLDDPDSRCRTIAARLVDAKAQAMASRIDELPSRIMQVSSETRLDSLIQELGRVVLITRAWLANQDDAELTRLVGKSETRESILDSPASLRVDSRWEVIGEQVITRRDGLVSQSTWLMNLNEGNRFALLLDFFPASLGKRASTFTHGEQFKAELAFYPARLPLRAVIAKRDSSGSGTSDVTEEIPWPNRETAHRPLDSYRDAMRSSPWTCEWPLLLPDGQIAQVGRDFWWQSSDGSLTLPIDETPDLHIACIKTRQSVGLWDGNRLSLLAAQSAMGRLSYAG